MPSNFASNLWFANIGWPFDARALGYGAHSGNGVLDSSYPIRAFMQLRTTYVPVLDYIDANV